MDEIKRFKFRWVATPVFLLLVFFIWSSDRVTLQGERTIYTVNCVNGTWDGHRCNGLLTTGPRFRYRALKAHGEVLFWVGRTGAVFKTHRLYHPGRTQLDLSCKQ
jgi:hypothetical protein